MRRLGLLAAGAALALAACSDGGVPLPNTPAGAQAPVELTPTPPTRGRANLSDEERTRWEESVRNYLDAMQQQSGLPKHEQIADVIVPMDPGTDHRWYVDLVAGATYHFVGACDADCSNVDVEIIAPQGGVAASDLLPDDYPVATITPQQDGRYIARVLMRACEVAPCYAGVRALTEPAAAAAPNKP
jgi:hypothetical protein